MSCLFASLLLALTLTMHAQELPFDELGCILPGELSRLRSERNLDNRIRIYDAASNRCGKLVLDAISKEDPHSLTRSLASWMSVLELSLKDISANANPKKKSRALIRYEINLRKAIGNVDEFKLKATYEQIDEIESWIRKADGIRKRFVDILFQR
jgi:hypothetical protein